MCGMWGVCIVAESEAMRFRTLVLTCSCTALCCAAATQVADEPRVSWVAEQLAGLSLTCAPPPAVSAAAAAASRCRRIPLASVLPQSPPPPPFAHVRLDCSLTASSSAAAGAAEDRRQVPGAECGRQAVVPRRCGARLRGRPGELCFLVSSKVRFFSMLVHLCTMKTRCQPRRSLTCPSLLLRNCCCCCCCRLRPSTMSSSWTLATGST